MLTKFTSQLIADTGISTGDEGKGRVILEIVNELRETHGRDDVVAAVMKVNGGSNSGHTVAGLKLNLLPGGVADPLVPHLPIGCGVVADPRKFLWECAYAELHGHVALKRLAIDERCLVSDLCHRLLDLAWEDYRVHVQQGEPRLHRAWHHPRLSRRSRPLQIVYADFGDKATFAAKMHGIDRALRVIEHVCQVAPERGQLLRHPHRRQTRANGEIIDAGCFDAAEFDFGQFAGSEPFTLQAEQLIDAYWAAGQQLAPQVCDVRELVLREQDKGNTIIGEFGQAYWLDKRHGFPPNVTASHTFTPEFFQSAGIPAQPIHNVGCCAYDTKVGTHVFLSEIDLDHPLSTQLRKIEFGATTGRQRMVGWYDAVEKGDALRYGGYDDLVLNKLDALSYSGDWQGELQICVAYQAADGTVVHHVPRDDAYRRSLTPVYKLLPGWSVELSGVRSFADLPENAMIYVAWLMKALIEVANHGDSNKTASPTCATSALVRNPARSSRTFLTSSTQSCKIIPVLIRITGSTTKRRPKMNKKS